MPFGSTVVCNNVIKTFGVRKLGYHAALFTWC